MSLFFANAKISQVHGQSMLMDGRVVVPMYHPAAALHQASLRPVIENDFAKLPQLIADAGEPPEIQIQEEEDKQDPEQLSLF
jgi:DNA polymerase